MSEATGEGGAPKFPTIGQRAEERKFQEREPRGGYNIVFEPAHHPQKGQLQSYVDKSSAGDPTVRVWNSELAERMNYQPSIITLDSSYATDNFYKDSDDSVLLHTWLALPTDPSMLNRSGSVNLVRTDQFVPEGVIDALTGSDVDTTHINDILYNLTKADSSSDGGYSEFKNDKDALLLLGLLGAVGGAGILATLPTQMVKRRKFLQYAASVVGLALVGPSAITAAKSRVDLSSENSRLSAEAALRDQISKVQSMEEKDRLIAQYDSQFADQGGEWARARNALFSLKTKGAYDRLGIDRHTPSAIIAGSSHTGRMQQIIGSDEYAGEVLRTYVGGLFAKVDNYYARHLTAGETHSLTSRQIKSALVDFISLAQIDEVRDVDKTLFKSKPAQAVRDATKTGEIYKERRIYTALAPLLTSV